MALPSTVTSVSLAIQGSPPPFTSGGSFYTVVSTSPNVFKADSDDPTGTWTEQDSSGAPTQGNNSVGQSATQDGTVLYITHGTSAAAVNIRYSTFDMSTDTWTTIDELVYSESMTLPNPISTSIAFRGVSGDELVIVVTGVPDKDMGLSFQRVDYFHKDKTATTWTGPVAIDEGVVSTNYYVPKIVLGTNDHCHISYIEDSASDLQLKTLNASNSLSTAIDFTTTNPTPETFSPVGNIFTYDDGGTERIRQLVRASTGRGFTAHAQENGTTQDAETDSTTEADWGAEEPYLSPDDIVYFTSDTDGTDIWVVFIGGGADGVDRDLYYTKSSDDGASWDTPTLIRSGTFTRLSGQIYTRDSNVVFAFVYEDSDTRYDEVVISSSGETLSPTAISSTEAFGTAIVNPGVVTLSPTGLASAEAFGTLALVTELITLSPTAISTAEAIGSATLTVGPVTLSPTGLTSKENFGSATISVAAITVTPTGITSDEAFGTAQLDFSTQLSPTGIVGAEAFGTLVVSTGVVTLSPTGLASGEALGAPVVTPGAITLSPSAIASGEAHGSPTLSTGVVTVSPTGLATGEAFGSTVISTIQGTGIASVEAVGTPTIGLASTTLSPTEIATAEAFGTPTVIFSVQLSPTAIASTEAFGTTVLSTTITASPSSITSLEAIGAAVISPGVVTLSPSAISSAEGIGTLTVTPGLVTISPTALTSSEIFGTPTLTLPIGGQTLTVVSIASGEKFGWVQDVQHENTDRIAAGVEKDQVERQFTLNWGRESFLDKTYED